MSATGVECAERASPLGRWPANVIHDGSDAVTGAFASFGERGAAAPVRGTEASMAGESGVIYGLRQRVPGAFHGDTGSAARFFYCAKASRADRNEGCDEFPEVVTDVLARHRSRRMEEMKRPDGAEPTKGRNIHPTVKPTELMRYLCRLVTPPGGVVLDPFMGSGSTGKAAMLEGFRFIGIDMTAEYVEIAKARVAFGWNKRLADTAQGDLFGSAA